MENRTVVRECPQRLADAYRDWIQGTEVLVSELHSAANLSEAIFYSEPVYLAVDLDAGTIDFRSRFGGPPVADDELDEWLMTAQVELPVIITGENRRVLSSFALPKTNALIARLLKLGVEPEFGGAERVERALQPAAGR